VYASYTFTDATYDKPWEAFSPNNPAAGECSEPGDDDVCLQVHRGDRIPGVPQHLFKAGFDYWVTHKWKFGADLIAASSQYFYGDENNSNAPLAGYAKVNLHTSYDVTDHIQIYGLIDNLFDTRFGTYGTYFDTDEASDVSLGEMDFKNPRSITPSMPFAAYGGVKVRF
jgi:outer membrane receptor protein involved in Fe transport